MKLNPNQTPLENAAIILPKMARKYFKAGRIAIGGRSPAHNLHSFRLKTKRFRYILELFRPLYGPKVDEYLEKLRELQSALGAVTDCEAIRRVLSANAEVELRVVERLEASFRKVLQTWRKFDSEGELNRWRTYLSGRRSKRPCKAVSRARKGAVPSRALKGKGKRVVKSDPR
jgi:CHAD domain-containing protein